MLTEELALRSKYVTWDRAESLGALLGAYIGVVTLLADHSLIVDASRCLYLRP